MKEYFDASNKKKVTRQAIIGLGENSIRKNYYPELQDKVLDLERINVRNKALMAAIQDIMLVSDSDGHISPFTVSNKKDNPLTLEILRNNEIVRRLQEAIYQAVQKREMFTCDFRLNYQGRNYYFESRIHISEINEILILVRDMTERTLMEMQLREMAERDSLTKLYKRHYLINKLAEFHGKSFEKLTVLLLDIDGLKIINDTFGHLKGDEVIVSVARIIHDHFRLIGYIARIGGDEFCVIVEGLSSQEIEQQLKQMNKMLYKHNEQTDTLKISLSSGYSFHMTGIVNTEWMFQEANNNMYQNKLLKESSNRNDLVKTLMRALEAKDFITEGHAERMGELATQMGVALRLPQSKLDRIRLLAKFHDIGKVGIPDRILDKPSKLNEEEWKVMKTHCGIGERIAAESSELKSIAHLILKHHERWDGKGYPLGLKAGEIPIECRILSIVDTFDAMTNDRPYREALPEAEAIKEIVSCSQTQFDPNLVLLFKEIIEKPS
jgi:diguanylate cyclase (GGDEF)-like protein